MRFTPVHKTPAARTEQIILFRSSNQIFAISSSSVQEVRSVDSLAGASIEIDEVTVPKVRHVFKRGDRSVYVVNAALHFGLRPSPAALIFILRKTHVGLLIDGIEKMTTMARLQALSPAFCHEERVWYRGLTVLDQNVIPVVNPQGFLTEQELLQLNATAGALQEAEAASSPEVELAP